MSSNYLSKTNTEITFRADCGLCRGRTLTWCEKNNVYYIVGIPGNANLYKETEVITDLLQKQYHNQVFYQ